MQLAAGALQNRTTYEEPVQTDGSKMRAHAHVIKENRSARFGLPCANCKAYNAFSKTIHGKRQFLGIVGSLTDSYSHNQSLSRISRELDVVARRNGSIPLTHKASVRI